MSGFSDFKKMVMKEDLDQLKGLFLKEYIDYVDDVGWTALHWACAYNKQVKVIKYLLEQGWDIEAVTAIEKWRPVHLATYNGNCDILTELIARSCRTDVYAKNVGTPLDVALLMNKKDCQVILERATKKPTPSSRKVDPPSERRARSSSLVNTMPSLTEYKKGNLLGRGGFGIVFKCQDQLTGRFFAMKEVLLGIGDSISQEVKSLENEINIYKDVICHPRIVQYFGTSQDVTSMYIFMEYMAGGSIKDQLSQFGPLSPNIIARYMKQILEGLAFLHHKMIIHRDLKASNLLRDIDGNVKLSDFGTSRYLNSISMCTTATTKAAESNQPSFKNSLCGTLYWMAPEVIRGEKYSKSADIWSLGATVVEMLTGNPPYYDLEPCAALFKIGSTMKVEYQPPQPLAREFQFFLDNMFVSDHRKRATVDILIQSDFVLNSS